MVVVEAALRSGSLITARLALEAGRELFAVPGTPLDPRCRGSNDLIRQGAHPDRNRARTCWSTCPPRRAPAPLFAAPAALDRRPIAPAEPRRNRAAPDDARPKSLELLGLTPIAVDEVMRRCHLSPSAVQAILLDLELAGRVEMLPGNRVALAGPA